MHGFCVAYFAVKLHGVVRFLRFKVIAPMELILQFGGNIFVPSYEVGKPCIEC